MKLKNKKNRPHRVRKSRPFTVADIIGAEQVAKLKAWAEKNVQKAA